MSAPPKPQPPEPGGNVPSSAKPAPNLEIQDEIAMLRSATRRSFEIFSRLANAADDPPPTREICEALGALGLAAVRTSALLKAQLKLSGGQGALSQELEAALRGLYQDWSLDL